MVDKHLITEDVEEKVITFGSLHYSADKMANILGWDEKYIVKQMNDKSSDFSKLYKRGSDIAEYLLDKKLFEMAKSGDLKAMEKYEIKKKIRLT